MRKGKVKEDHAATSNTITDSNSNNATNTISDAHLPTTSVTPSGSGGSAMDSVGDVGIDDAFPVSVRKPVCNRNRKVIYWKIQNEEAPSQSATVHASLAPPMSSSASSDDPSKPRLWVDIVANTAAVSNVVAKSSKYASSSSNQGKKDASRVRVPSQKRSPKQAHGPSLHPSAAVDSSSQRQSLGVVDGDAVERLWTFCYHNLHRSVDEIYYMCEVERSVRDCEFAIQAMDACRDDFVRLIERLKLEDETTLREAAKKGSALPTSAGKKPKGTAWSLRKTSPSHGGSLLSSSARPPSATVDGADASKAPAQLPQSEPSLLASEAGEKEARPRSGTLDISKTVTMAPIKIKSTSWADMVDSSPEVSPNASPASKRSPVRDRIRHERLAKGGVEEKRTIDIVVDIREKQNKATCNKERIENERSEKIEASRAREKMVLELRKESVARLAAESKQRMEKAETKREEYLQDRVRCAAMESQKVEEIAFISQLELENRKMELDGRLQNSEKRRDGVLEKVVKKQDAEALNAEAARERRRQNEAEEDARAAERERKREETLQRREIRLKEIRGKRGETDARIESALERRKLMEAEKIARIQERIEKKMTKSELNRQENLENIKSKAAAELDKVSRAVSERQEASSPSLQSSAPASLAITPIALAANTVETEDDAPSSDKIFTQKDAKVNCRLCAVNIPNVEALRRHVAGKRHLAALDKEGIVDDICIDDIFKSGSGLDTTSETVGPPSSTIQDDGAPAKDASKDKPRDRGESHRPLVKKKAKKVWLRMQVNAMPIDKFQSIYSVIPLTYKGKGKDKCRITRILTEIDRVLRAGQPRNILERLLQDACRVLESKDLGDCETCRTSGGVEIFLALATGFNGVESFSEWTSDKVNAMDDVITAWTDIDIRVIMHAIKAYYYLSLPALCKTYMLMTNKLAPLVSLFVSIPFTSIEQSTVPLIAQLLFVLTIHLRRVAITTDEKQMKGDLIRYMVYRGALDRTFEILSVYERCHMSASVIPQVVQRSLLLIEALTAFPEVQSFSINTFGISSPVGNTILRSDSSLDGDKTASDVTGDGQGGPLLEAMRVNGIISIVGLLSTILLVRGPSRRSLSPAKGVASVALPPVTRPLLLAIKTALRILSNISYVDLRLIQGVFASVGAKAEIMLVFSSLLSLTTIKPSKDMVGCDKNDDDDVSDVLHELLLVLGYMCVDCPDYQEAVLWRSPQSQSLLHRLLALPFKYFNDTILKSICLPTLITMSFRSEKGATVLKSELSPEIILTFISENPPPDEDADVAVVGDVRHEMKVDGEDDGGLDGEKSRVRSSSEIPVRFRLWRRIPKRHAPALNEFYSTLSV